MAITTLVLPLFIAFAQDPAPGTLGQDEAEKTLTAAEVKAHIAFLSSDEMQGRNTPSPELDKAAAYVAAEFKRLGLKGVGDEGGYIKSWTYHDAKVPNCVGFLEGGDATLKDEVVIIGGHMDHIGTKGREVMNGADDNASGTTGVLELAEAFASLKQRPRRSVLFMTFSGEEKGLLGSRAYCAAPAIPLEKCVAMINLDMIGRSADDYLFIGGTGTSAAFPGLIAKAGEGLGFKLETAPGGFAPSDNTNFHEHGLPVLFFFTNIHADYHGADDLVEKINAEGEAKILRMVFRVASDIAGRPERLPFTSDRRQALPKDFEARSQERFGGGPRPARNKVMLGVQGDADEKGFKVTLVVEGQPAQKAGIAAGDVITTLNGAKVREYTELREAMKKVKPGETVKIVLLRDGKELALDVAIPEK